MTTPEWLKPGIYGAIVGAMVLAIAGFSWGGWMTTATAAEMAEDDVRTAMVPVCVEMARLDPDREMKMAKVKSASGYSRRTAVMEAGWATAPGTDTPDRDLAKACVDELDLDAT